MAIRIQTYYKTTDLTTDQLKSALLSCRTQDYKILELFKTYGRMTQWDVYDLYNELIGDILPSSVGRSINSLKRNNAIIDSGNIPGPMNRPVTLYCIVDNPPTELKTFNKSVPSTVSIDVVLNEEGMIDVDKMYDLLSEKIVSLTEKHNI